MNESISTAAEGGLSSVPLGRQQPELRPPEPNRLCWAGDRPRSMVDELISEGVSTFLISTAPAPDWKFEDDHELWLILRVGG